MIRTFKYGIQSEDCNFNKNEASMQAARIVCFYCLNQMNEI